MAGTGKTTIAQTIAERVFADGHLGASFFCSRDYSDRSDLQFIFPTIAVQLARKYTDIRSILIPLLRSNPGIIHETLSNQMNKLIVGPLKKSGISTVIVIDALDECKDRGPASAILSVLGQFVSQIPKVKFFLTGRPEQQIQGGFHLLPLVKATDVFVLHEVESSQVDSDIQLFFKHEFSKLRAHQGGLDSWPIKRDLDNWPTQKDLDLLCEQAAGLFVYAVATIKFIDDMNWNPMVQLDLVLRSPGKYEGTTKFNQNTTLDSLYMSILQEAFGHSHPERDPTICSVLGAVVLAANPLSPYAIAALLGLDPTSVFLQLSSVHSLLILQDNNHPVQPFHKSFPDFITNLTRCTNKRFYISPPTHHLELFLGCLKFMNQTLGRNMCKLPDAVLNSEVNDLHERIEQYLDPALQYACKSWHKHLVDENVANTPTVTSVLHHFLENKFLFWLEVLSVLGVTREAVDALGMVAQWLEVC